MLVSLSMETVNGETGFYSSWAVWPVLCLASMVRRNSALFTLLQGPRPAPQPRGGGTSHLQTRESPTGETLPRLTPNSSGFVRPLFRLQLLILKHTLGFCSLPL